MHLFSLVRSTIFALLAGLLLIIPKQALAVPSFARGTGFSCAQCHTQFPELTPFGRAFKASGYTMVIKKTVSAMDEDRTILSFLEGVPLSAMMQASATFTAQAVPGANGTAQNASVVFPQQLSLFYAGRITPDVGAFTQFTYSGKDDKFSIDNADIRYAHTTTLFDEDFTWGVSLNNNPTVTDLWHGTPAWSFPWAGSDVAPTPSAGPLIAGGLAQGVVGLNAYGFWGKLVYAEAGAYRSFYPGASQPLGSAADATNVIQAVAPYWRLAVQKDITDHISAEVGTFGLYASMFPGGSTGLVSPTNKYLYSGADAQFQTMG